MRNVNILNLSLYQIQMFLSVAKSENITRSARYLHIAQPTLSKNIAAIERELGLILFLRDKNRLRLTPAGKVLAQELRTASEMIENALNKAYCAQAAVSKPLKIGFSDSTSQDKYLLPSIASFRSIVSNFNYNIEFYQFKDLPFELLAGNVDVIFTTLFELESIHDTSLEYVVLKTFPLTIHVTPESPLADRDWVSIDDISKMRLIMPSPRIMPNYYKNVILPLFGDEKSIPEVAYFASSSEAIAANIVASDEVFISDCCRKVEPFFNLVRIPLADTESGVVMAWNKTQNPMTESFIKNTILYWKNREIQ